jgi:hypothetical protein
VLRATKEVTDQPPLPERCPGCNAERGYLRVVGDELDCLYCLRTVADWIDGAGQWITRFMEGVV